MVLFRAIVLLALTTVTTGRRSFLRKAGASGFRRHEFLTFGLDFLTALAHGRATVIHGGFARRGQFGFAGRLGCAHFLFNFVHLRFFLLLREETGHARFDFIGVGRVALAGVD